MKHRYPRHLRERYQQKKIKEVEQILDGEVRFGESVLSKDIIDMINQNEIRMQLMIDMMTRNSLPSNRSW